MKKLTLIMSAMALVPMLSVASIKGPDNEDVPMYKFSGDLAFAGFCKSVLHNDVSMLRRNVSQQVGRVAATSRGVYRSLLDTDGVTCAGQDLVSFSQSRKAEEVLAYLQRRASAL
ncbi:hypothetical protein [Lacimicrobium alkaliphilum]|uniref:DUF3718 domain-containing protein n=1 Tax=Lacimicrobium alkaliphilum TaxID=1526571 RepID=A0A0U2RRL2_9ALTE|nr:hypothetical protein [Lacimicrobium alkaliphilum]ALS99994.1 hypothetical protein AT746_18140 [Lacimicrobium alkaliphilum]